MLSCQHPPCPYEPPSALNPPEQPTKTRQIYSEITTRPVALLLSHYTSSLPCPRHHHPGLTSTIESSRQRQLSSRGPNRSPQLASSSYLPPKTDQESEMARGKNLAPSAPLCLGSNSPSPLTCQHLPKNNRHFYPNLLFLPTVSHGTRLTSPPPLPCLPCLLDPPPTPFYPCPMPFYILTYSSIHRPAPASHTTW